MKRIGIAMSFLSFLFGCGDGKQEEATQPETSDVARVANTLSEGRVVEPAQGTILVQNGTPELLRKAIEAYVGLSGRDVPKEFRVTFATHASGSMVVRFPDGAMPYEFVNLIGWLNDPPEICGVSDARGWITSPSTGIRYSLKPETENRWGDTLVGRSSDGRSVRVYLPEAGLCEISRSIGTDPEPDLENLGDEAQVTFSVVMEVATGFGNYEFKITDPKDTAWGP